jgi:hypothetical protein
MYMASEETKDLRTGLKPETAARLGSVIEAVRPLHSGVPYGLGGTMFDQVMQATLRADGVDDLELTLVALLHKAHERKRITPGMAPLDEAAITVLLGTVQPPLSSQQLTRITQTLTHLRKESEPTKSTPSTPAPSKPAEAGAGGTGATAAASSGQDKLLQQVELASQAPVPIRDLVLGMFAIEKIVNVEASIGVVRALTGRDGSEAKAAADAGVSEKSTKPLAWHQDYCDTREPVIDACQEKAKGLPTVLTLCGQAKELFAQCRELIASPALALQGASADPAAAAAAIGGPAS